MRLLVHKEVRLYNTQDVHIDTKKLTPAVMEDKLPHAIICDKRLFLLLIREDAAYKEVLPHLINEPLRTH